MAVALSNEELEALEGLSPFQKCIYIFGIRLHMDYKTGLTTTSYLSIAKRCYVREGRGIEDGGIPHKSKVRRAVDILEKIGLVKIKRQTPTLIFDCILRGKGNLKQNKPDTNPTQFVDTQEIKKPDTVDKSIETFKNKGISKNKMKNPTQFLSEKLSIPDTGNLPIPDTDQISDNITTKQLHTDHQISTGNNIDHRSKKIRGDRDSSVDKLQGFQDFWKLYPRQVGKIAAQKKWVTKKCAELTAVILENLQWRLKNEWTTGKQKQFIPHPATYLNQGRWDDERERYQPTNEREEKRLKELAATENKKLAAALAAEYRQIQNELKAEEVK